MNSMAGGKENKNFLAHVRKQNIALSLRSLDEKNNQNGDNLLVVDKSKDEAGYTPQRFCRPTAYNTAKLKYKATKARGVNVHHQLNHKRTTTCGNITHSRIGIEGAWPHPTP